MSIYRVHIIPRMNENLITWSLITTDAVVLYMLVRFGRINPHANLIPKTIKSTPYLLLSLSFAPPKTITISIWKLGHCDWNESK